jgi:hypothetical protein
MSLCCAAAGEHLLSPTQHGTRGDRSQGRPVALGPWGDHGRRARWSGHARRRASPSRPGRDRNSAEVKPSLRPASTSARCVHRRRHNSETPRCLAIWAIGFARSRASSTVLDGTPGDEGRASRSPSRGVLPPQRSCSAKRGMRCECRNGCGRARRFAHGAKSGVATGPGPPLHLRKDMDTHPIGRRKHTASKARLRIVRHREVKPATYPVWFTGSRTSASALIAFVADSKMVRSWHRGTRLVALESFSAQAGRSRSVASNATPGVSAPNTKEASLRRPIREPATVGSWTPTEDS